MKSNFKKKTIKTLFAYNVFFVIVVMIIYCVITRLLSYPPNSINTEFEKNIDVTTVFTVLYMNLEKYAYGHYRKHTVKQMESDNICLR